MQIKILKGTDQIGGAFTEITTKQARILIDFRRWPRWPRT